MSAKWRPFFLDPNSYLPCVLWPIPVCSCWFCKIAENRHDFLSMLSRAALLMTDFYYPFKDSGPLCSLLELIHLTQVYILTFQSREVGFRVYPIAFNFDMDLSSTAIEAPVKYHRDRTTLWFISRLHGITIVIIIIIIVVIIIIIIVVIIIIIIVVIIIILLLSLLPLSFVAMSNYWK